MAATSRQLGVRVNDYGTDVRRGIELATRQAFGAVELGVDREEVAPANLTESGRRHLARLVTNSGLNLAALAQETEGFRLADPAHVDEGVARAAQVLRLAADMRVPVVSHDVGELLGLSDEKRDCAVEAVRALAGEAERLGTVYAIRSSLAAPAELGALLQAVACPLVRVSVDPAALLMGGFDPVEALVTLGEQVSLAYVRDALRGVPQRFGRETALGEGSLDLHSYLGMLSAQGYRTAPILRRTHAAAPAEALAHDRDRLTSALAL